MATLCLPHNTQRDIFNIIYSKYAKAFELAEADIDLDLLIRSVDGVITIDGPAKENLLWSTTDLPIDQLFNTFSMMGRHNGYVYYFLAGGIMFFIIAGDSDELTRKLQHLDRIVSKQILDEVLKNLAEKKSQK